MRYLSVVARYHLMCSFKLPVTRVPVHVGSSFDAMPRKIGVTAAG